MNNTERTPEQNSALLAIDELVTFAFDKQLIKLADLDYARNLLLSKFRFDEPYDANVPLLASVDQGEAAAEPQLLIDTLIDYAFSIDMLKENTDTYRDLMDAEIMGMLMARPSEVTSDFFDTLDREGIEAATDQFYQLSIHSNYIRMDRVAKNVYWKQPTTYGDMEMTINLSKPEKTSAEIAQAKLLPPPSYPKCQLCRENVGYAGRINHPARQNLRVVPLMLSGEAWFLQYSPYVYYNEHCIVFHHDHVPMQLTRQTFRRLLDFVEEFPHYFLGSNADLPIVGGSILTHDHFQGGRHTFPIEKAAVEEVYRHTKREDITLELVNWPMSVIRLRAYNDSLLLDAADEIYEAWKGYSDAEVDILSSTPDSQGNPVRHNTVTPIVRRRGEQYEMDLVLRNNRTSEQYPDGIFHPHPEMHHIKRENIGLIEVMGLAILPGRLKEELDQIGSVLAGDAALLEIIRSQPDHALHLHLPWVEQMIEQYGTELTHEQATWTIQDEVGRKFAEILEHAGVYKKDDAGRAAFRRFVQSAGYVQA
ncbi:UDP-glucose--hexose-1-phosphate uridylyltransferase [Paenibacillus sp. WLX2291]|uniref:UDP-glucose--hexose-1-phosphate uridylyltransferase n=1 Tax=Paenibacillus sp. WLX2291 TaxID=3296934 RepID=UPI0039840FC1